jgi:hypothetical protein
MKKRHLVLTAVFSLFLVGLSLSFPLKAKAQGGLIETVKDIYSTYVSNMNENLGKKVKDDVDAKQEGTPSQGANTTGIFKSIFENTYVFVAGPPDQALAGLTEEEKAIAHEIYGPSAIGSVSNYIATLYQPPASSTTYIADVFESAKIIPEAQAQGTGFAALNPILETWKTFRNLAYMFFVVIFLVIGFMIMFRHKIDGQTVVTAQQAIPNIVISLIFVTFSYAIAGLMIDLMYVFMYLIVGLFGGSRQLLNQNIFQLGFRLITQGFGESLTTVNQSIQQIVSVAGLKQIAGWTSSLTVSVIVAIAILFSVFKLFLELLKSYIMIILNVAFGPLFLMMGALPGNNTFGNWVKQIVGNLSAFPAVLMLMLISDMLANYNLQSGGFMPPFMLGQGIGGAMPAIVGIGILLITPEAIQQVKKALGVEEGIFGQLASSAMSQAKTGAPLGGRLGGLATGGTMGGLAGGLGGLVTGSLQRQPLHGMWRGMKKGASAGTRGFNIPGTDKFVPGTLPINNWISRSMGSNQPDLANPLTEAIDKRFDPEGLKKQKNIQLLEDAMQHARSRSRYDQDDES